MELMNPYIQCNIKSGETQYKIAYIFTRNICFCVLPVLSWFCGGSHGKSTHDRVLSIRDSYFMCRSQAQRLLPILTLAC